MASRSRFLLVITLLGLFGLILPAAVLADCTAVPGNIVANCGFETGAFNPEWTTVPAASGSIFGVDGNPHSGAHAAAFGAVSLQNDYIYQDLATTSGTNYDVNFWLDASQGVTGQFVALWNGTIFFTQPGDLPGGYFDYNFLLPASTSGSTRLEFGGNSPPSFYYLDDVSVVPSAVSTTPEPSAIFLFATGLMAIGGSIKRKMLSQGPIWLMGKIVR